MASIYNLSAVSFIDSTCGNCLEPDTPVSATYGLRISGKNITISGPEDRSAVIYTNSGYGLYIKDCERCILENLTITGGIRDSAAFASDAAIVVSNSSVTIRDNIITRNLGDSLMIAKNISGIMGICGREVCCASYIQKFTPIHINMAKIQKIALNQSKVSGLCGRLMCCLSYESEFYKECLKKYPRLKDDIETEKGTGKVIEINVLKKYVVAELEPNGGIKKRIKISEEELEKLRIKNKRTENNDNK